MGIESDLNLTQAESNWAVALFFLAYVSCFSVVIVWNICAFFQLIFEFPSNILMRCIGSSLYLSLSLLAWGSISVGMAFVKNARELLAVRFFLVSQVWILERIFVNVVIAGCCTSGILSQYNHLFLSLVSQERSDHENSHSLLCSHRFCCSRKYSGMCLSIWFELKC